MGSLDGRVALITGAGRGIGREEALFFAAEGAKVVVNDPGVAPDGSGGNTSVAAAVVEEITAAGGTAVASTDSVSDWQGAKRMVDTAVDAFGDLHIVVNNASIHGPRALVNLTEESFDDVMAAKVPFTFTVSHWAARHWRRQHEAGVRADRAIVNTASGSGLLNPLPTHTSYAAANAGVGAMTIVHSLELGRYGVRVNCIAPSMVRTRLTHGVPGLQEPPPDGTFDPWHPVHQAVVAAYLAGAGCPLSGQVLTVRGSTVILNRNWSPGEHASKDNAGWTVEELGVALDKLPFEDQFEKLATLISTAGGALGAGSREQLQQMVDSMLDNDERPEPGKAS